jgi:hypothetical protein
MPTIQSMLTYFFPKFEPTSQPIAGARFCNLLGKCRTGKLLGCSDKMFGSSNKMFGRRFYPWTLRKGAVCGGKLKLGGMVVAPSDLQGVMRSGRIIPLPEASPQMKAGQLLSPGVDLSNVKIGGSFLRSVGRGIFRNRFWSTGRSEARLRAKLG